MEEIKTIKEKTIELIDALKATCQTYGMGNDGNEYKIITQVFLYKFLNDKFGYEVKKVSPVLKNAEKWELAYAEMSEDDRLDIFDSLPSDIPLLNPEHLIANLWNQQAKGDFDLIFDSTMTDLFMTKSVREQLERSSSGTKVKHTSPEKIYDVEVEIPDVISQQKIANLLWSVDEKIANNKAINDNLEQQLMLLYDYWFTQFDFPDNDGNPYQTSGGKMVWNDTLKRNIPENWKVQSVISNCLSSIIKPGVEIFNTKTYLATADVKGTSISTGTIVDYDGRESRANMQPSINSVWFAKMKNSIKHLYLNKEMQPIISSCILSTGFCGLQCNEISFEYIASYVSNAYFEIHKDMLAHGATQEAVNNDDLAGVHIIIPEDTVLRAYHEATQAIYAQISKNICENQELVKLRDWLLPMLMNGQATISD